MNTYLVRHLQTFFYSLGQLARTPVATAMTLGVIGITLALPTGMFILIDNLQEVSGGINAGTRISLFLKKDIEKNQLQSLLDRLKKNADIGEVQYISPEEALDEFNQHSGFGQTLKILDRNPLPPVIIITPAKADLDPPKLEKLSATLQTETGVETAQLDMEWIKRLHALLELGRRGIWLLAALLGLAVILVIGNTIRLAVLNRREEIVIIKLVGGTAAFIRRPFLYSGIQQGVLGALLAWILVHGSLWALSAPVQQLAQLYGSEFDLSTLDIASTLSLLGVGGLLGWLGSRLAVGRHLREIEPR